MNKHAHKNPDPTVPPVPPNFSVEMWNLDASCALLLPMPKSVLKYDENFFEQKNYGFMKGYPGLKKKYLGGT